MSLKKEFDELKNPNELMNFMDEKIKYGWIGKDGELRENSVEGFLNNYRVSSLEEILENGYGTCFEQVELEREFFSRQKITSSSYMIIASHMVHSFLVFEMEGKFYRFEHSSWKNKGIYEFDSIDNLLQNTVELFMNNHKIKSAKRITLISYSKLRENIDLKDMKEELLSNRKNLVEKLFK